MPNPEPPPPDPIPPADAPGPQQPAANQTLDLESDAKKESIEAVTVPDYVEGAPYDVAQVPYDPAKMADETRQYISYTLLGLLIGVVLLAFIVLLLLENHSQTAADRIIATIDSKATADKFAPVLTALEAETKASSDRLSALLNIVFGPVVTLLGSVTGFYFGTQSAKPSGSVPSKS